MNRTLNRAARLAAILAVAATFSSTVQAGGQLLVAGAIKPANPVIMRGLNPQPEPPRVMRNTMINPAHMHTLNPQPEVPSRKQNGIVNLKSMHTLNPQPEVPSSKFQPQGFVPQPDPLR